MNINHHTLYPPQRNVPKPKNLVSKNQKINFNLTYPQSPPLQYSMLPKLPQSLHKCMTPTDSSLHSDLHFVGSHQCNHPSHPKKIKIKNHPTYPPPQKKINHPIQRDSSSKKSTPSLHTTSPHLTSHPPKTKTRNITKNNKNNYKHTNNQTRPNKNPPHTHKTGRVAEESSHTTTDGDRFRSSKKPAMSPH